MILEENKSGNSTKKIQLFFFFLNIKFMLANV